MILLSLGLLLASCVEPAASPAPAARPANLGALAREAALIFGRVAAYDYALAGHFAGERVRVVTAERYASALAPDVRRLTALKEELTALAFADPSRAGPAVALADAIAALADSLAGFAATKDGAAFAGVVRALDGGWSTLRALGSVLPDRDAELEAALSRGTAWKVTPTRGRAYVVITAPTAERAGAYGRRDAAEQRVAELRAGGVEAAIAEEDAFTFARSGAQGAELPPELRREAALEAQTPERARRAAFVSGGFAIAHEDGSVRGYDSAGRVRWSAQLANGLSLLAPNVTGRWILAGGIEVALLTHEGKLVGDPLRLTSAASAAAWSEPLNAIVVASAGPTGRPEGGGGVIAAVSIAGKPLAEPFPLTAPAAGALLAAAPGKDEVYVATTTRGDTDLEVMRPGIDASTANVLRVAGQQQRLAVSLDGSRIALITSRGTYRLSPRAASVSSSLRRLGDSGRDVRFDGDGTLYVLWADRLVAYDDALRARWTAKLVDGRRVAVGRQVVVQDGLGRVLAVDPATGASEELAAAGDVVDLAVSQDGARVLVLVAGRALVFALP